MVDILILYFYLAQHLVPTVSALLLELLHISSPQLLEILPCLRIADERRSHTSLHLFASLLNLKRDDGSHVVAFLFVAVLVFAILHTKHSIKVVVELYHKVIPEIIGHSPTVSGRIAYDLSLGRKYLDITALVESIDNHLGAVGLRKSERHQGGTLGRTEFCRHIIIGEIDTIIIRCRLLCLVREPTGSLLLIENRLAYCRHQGELTIVVNPGTGLMGLLQSSYLSCSISILPSITHLSCLRNPEVHAPRHGDGWISIACRKAMIGIGSHERVDEIHRIQYIHLDGLRHQGEQCEYKHK